MKNLLFFDVDESLYSKPLSGYLIDNFHKPYGSYKVQTQLLQLSLEVNFLVGSYSDELGSYSYSKIVTSGLIH